MYLHPSFGQEHIDTNLYTQFQVNKSLQNWQWGGIGRTNICIPSASEIAQNYIFDYFILSKNVQGNKKAI